MINFTCIIIVSAILLTLIILIEFFIDKRKKFPYSYVLKDCLMTNTELKYFNAFKSILNGSPYILQPQVCLASIIERKEAHKFQSELSRIVDFAIFSPEYCPILLIEINDSSHLKKDRKERDKKVKFILKSAKIPLMTVWTKNQFDIKSLAKELKSFGLKIDLGNIYDGIQQ